MSESRPNIIESLLHARANSNDIHDVVDWMQDAVISWRNDPETSETHEHVEYETIDPREDQVITVDMAIKLVFECADFFESLQVRSAA